MYILEIGPNTWIAPWDGDPGRTIVKENARVFGTKKKAYHYEG